MHAAGKKVHVHGCDGLQSEDPLGGDEGVEPEAVDMSTVTDEPEVTEEGVIVKLGPKYVVAETTAGTRNRIEDVARIAMTNMLVALFFEIFLIIFFLFVDDMHCA